MLKKTLPGLLSILALISCERSSIKQETRLRSGRIVKTVSLKTEKPTNESPEILVFECVWSVKPMAPGVPVLGDLEELASLVENEAERKGLPRIDIVIYGPDYFSPVPRKEALVHRLERKADGKWGFP